MDLWRTGLTRWRPRCRFGTQAPGAGGLGCPRRNSCPYSGVSLCVSRASCSTSVGFAKAPECVVEEEMSKEVSHRRRRPAGRGRPAADHR